MPEAIAAICVNDLETNKDFYVNTMDWQITETNEEGIYLHYDGSIILLTDKHDDVQQKLVNPKIVWKTGATLFLQEDGIEAKFAAMQTKNIQNVSFNQYFWGESEIRIAAPENITICISETSERSFDEWLDLYLDAVSYLEESIEKLPEQSLDQEQDGFTLRQHIHRLVIDDMQWIFPLHIALVEMGSVYQHNHIDLDKWLGCDSYKTMDIQPALAFLRTSRYYTAALIKNTENAWDGYIKEGEAEDSRRHPSPAFIRIQAMRSLHLVHMLRTHNEQID